jgi:hypothetical protein
MKLTQGGTATMHSAGWRTGAPSHTPPLTLSASAAVHGALRNYKFTWPNVCVCVCVCEISQISTTAFRESAIRWESKNYTQGTTTVRPSYSHAVLGGEGGRGVSEAFSITAVWKCSVILQLYYDENVVWHGRFDRTNCITYFTLFRH